LVLYNSSLFMLAAIVDHAVETRDSSLLVNFARSMPITALIACLAALSMAGIPPLLGFIGKELIYEASLFARLPTVAFAAVILANACMVVAASIIALRCFFGKESKVV